MLRRSRCRYCPATIVMVHMESGAVMPCNEPVRAVVVVGERGKLCETYPPHWGSCPGAAQAHADKAAKDKA